LSPAFGTHAPPAPPLLTAQWAGSVQFPVLPTQYRFRGVGEFKVQPELLPRSIALFAVNEAPPVAPISLRFTKSTVILPDDLLIIACDPGASDSIVMLALQEPLAAREPVIVCVLEASSVYVFPPVSTRVSNVLFKL